MKIIIGSDHAGYKLKQELKKYLAKKKITVEDAGTDSMKSTDYPDYAKITAKKIQKNKNNKGILICGTGIGMCIAANRYKNVRAAVVYDSYSAKMSRRDNDANVICLRARQFNHTKTKKLVNIWLKEKFAGLKRYKRRLKKLEK